VRKTAVSVGVACGLLSVFALVVGLVGCGSDGVSPNRAPRISALTANPSRLPPGRQAEVTCDAEDPDGDALTYAWTCTKGQFTGTGATVTWTAPNEVGTCTVQCTVNDGKAKATATKNIEVTVEPDPIEGDWWLYAYQDPGDASSQPFGPLDRYEYLGDPYEYIHIIFNADGTFVDLYKFCGEPEQRVEGTWQYDVGTDTYTVDHSGGVYSIVKFLSGTTIVGENSQGGKHWYQREENRYLCDQVGDDPTGTWQLQPLEFDFGGGPWVVDDAFLNIEEDKATGTISIGGNDGSVDSRWDGTYERNGSVLTATDMPEFEIGPDDLMDLDLTINGDQVTGTALNHGVVQGQSYSATATVTGTRSTTTVTSVAPARGGGGKTRKLR